MPSFEIGRAVSTGDTSPDIPEGYSSIYLMKISGDGTKRFVRHSSTNWAGAYIRSRDVSSFTVPAELDGYIAVASGGSDSVSTKFSVHFNTGGPPVYFVEPSSTLTYGQVTTDPVNPGPDFYRFRHHVGQAADHFEDRFSLDKINMRKATAHRITQIAGELSDDDRLKAGNGSLKLRTDNGYLWRRIHDFRGMPFGTTAHDTSWRAERDAIAALLVDHCDQCSRPIDITLSHDHATWKRYLDGGLRFHEPGGVATLIADTKLMTDELITADIRNHELAGLHFRSNNADDDFLTPRTSAIAEPSGLPSPTAITGNDALYRQAYIGYWVLQDRLVQAKTSLSASMKNLFSWFCAANAMALVRDYLWPRDHVKTVIEYNARYMSGRLFDTPSRSEVNYNPLIATYLLPPPSNANPGQRGLVDTDNPWFHIMRWMTNQTTAEQLDDDFMPLIPSTEKDAEGNWTLAARTKMATKLEGIFGRRILENSGDPTL